MSWKKLRIHLSIILMVGTIGVFVPLHPARADYWGANKVSALLIKYLDRLDRYIEGILLSKMKSIAINMLNQQIDKMFGGGGGNEPLFITDFREYIHGYAKSYTNETVNDFFTTSLRGKFSVSNYVEVGGIVGPFSEGISSGINAAAQVGQSMRNAVKDTLPAFDFDTKALDPGLRGGISFRDMNKLVTNPMNNSVGASFEAKRIMYASLSEQAEIQKIKAQASGFIPKEKGGKVIAPSALLEGMVVKVKTMADDVISMASNPEELIVGVINSYANQVINRVVELGIGKVEAAIEAKVGPIGVQLSREIRADIASEGAGAQFTKETQQKESANTPSMSKTTDWTITKSGCVFCAENGFTLSSITD